MGPGAYNADALTLTARTPRCVFAMSKRSDMAMNKGKPGPGAYNNAVKEHSVACVIGKSKKLLTEDRGGPGPADYNPVVESIGTRRTQSYAL